MIWKMVALYTFPFYNTVPVGMININNNKERYQILILSL